MLKFINIFFVVSLSSSPIVISKEPHLPPAEFKGQWVTLESKGYSKWNNIKLIRWGAAADGGSYVFDFRTKDGILFDIVIANRAYWTEGDKANSRQVIYITEAGRFYLLEPGSEQEKQMLKLLDLAESDIKNAAQIIIFLHETIKTRKEVVDSLEETFQ